MVEIVLCNEAPNLVKGDELARTANWLQQWINGVVAKAWSQGMYAVKSIGTASPPTPTDHLWLFHIMDTTDVPGAGGYHSLDQQGNPYAKIFAGDFLRAGQTWQFVLAHEAAETMMDRFVDAAVLVNNAAYLMEVADPFEASPLRTYTAAPGLTWPVPPIALPAYYKPGHAGPYDTFGVGTAPLTPAPGGRQAIYPLSGQATGLDADDPHISPAPTKKP